jgi:hypothetical protein
LKNVDTEESDYNEECEENEVVIYEAAVTVVYAVSIVTIITTISECARCIVI